VQVYRLLEGMHEAKYSTYGFSPGGKVGVIGVTGSPLNRNGKKTACSETAGSVDPSAGIRRGRYDGTSDFRGSGDGEVSMSKNTLVRTPF
jgi:hypothetical protein